MNRACKLRAGSCPIVRSCPCGLWRVVMIICAGVILWGIRRWYLMSVLQGRVELIMIIRTDEYDTSDKS